MKIKKWDKKVGYSIVINKDVEICISYEDNVGDFHNYNQGTRIYFIDYFDDNSDWEEGYNHDLSEVFDELYLAIEYLENNFNIPKKIIKKIKIDPNV